MKRTLLPILLFAMLLSACGLPMSRVTSTITPLSDPVQTQVSQILVQTKVSDLLTEQPATEQLPPPGTPLPAQATVIPPQATSTPVIVATALPEPTATQAPTATAAPTIVPTAAATNPTGPTTAPSTGDPKTRLGNPTWRDTFENAQNWPVGADTFTDMQVSNHALTLTGLSTKDGWRITWPILSDFYLEATIKSGNCAGTDRYGLIARVPEPEDADRGYLVGVTCDGKYSLREWDGEKMTNLIGWTEDKAIQTGSNQTNRVGLMAAGDQFSVYINGNLLKTVKDSTFSGGAFGLFVGGNKTANYSITVSEVVYWEDPTP